MQKDQKKDLWHKINNEIKQTFDDDRLSQHIKKG